jgi:hypothetical protein
MTLDVEDTCLIHPISNPASNREDHQEIKKGVNSVEDELDSG